jgi:glycosyltransferase involved in cell wall biosynthesis
MSFALPVIVARGDGTQSDLVRPGNGWQVPPDDLDALQSALRTALSDVPHLRAMGKESYRIVGNPSGFHVSMPGAGRGSFPPYSSIIFEQLFRFSQRNPCGQLRLIFQKDDPIDRGPIQGAAD